MFGRDPLIPEKFVAIFADYLVMIIFHHFGVMQKKGLVAIPIVPSNRKTAHGIFLKIL